MFLSLNTRYYNGTNEIAKDPGSSRKKYEKYALILASITRISQRSNNQASAVL